VNQQQFKNQITAAKELITNQIPKAETPQDAQLAALLVFGLEIVGELFLDIKRIADAAEKAGSPVIVTAGPFGIHPIAPGMPNT
jgi:hypothetical protein